MTPTGAISGRILNRYGEPVGNANVQAFVTPIRKAGERSLPSKRFAATTSGNTGFSG